MRLEYTEEQEKQLRITEIEAILENNLYENDLEEFMLDIEKQFLEGNETVYGEPFAVVGTEDKIIEVTLETLEDDTTEYSLLVQDKDGNRIGGYYYGKTLEEVMLNVIEVPMEIYIVFEYAEHTNKIVGCYRNEEDANKKHEESPTYRYIEKQKLL